PRSGSGEWRALEVCRTTEGKGPCMLELNKLVDGEPVLIAADQVARVHGRKDPKGKLFCEVHVIGGKKPIGVVERIDQVRDLLAAAGVGSVSSARIQGSTPQGG